MGLKERVTQGIREPIERATNLAIAALAVGILALLIALVRK